MLTRKKTAKYAEAGAHIGFVSFAFGLSFSIAWAHTSLTVMAAAWFLWRFTGSGIKWQRTPVDLSLGIFLLWTFVSIWVGREYGIHRHDLTKALGLPLILPFVLTLTTLRPQWGRQAVKFFLFGVGLHAFYALVIWVPEALYWRTLLVRLQGAFGMSLTYAEIAAMALIFLMVRGWKEGEKKIGRWVVPVVFLALVLTYARGTYIGFICGVVVVILVSRPRWFLPSLATTFAVLLAWASIPLVVDTNQFSGFGRKMLNPFGQEVRSNRHRYVMFTRGALLIRDNPLGVGPGNVLNTFPKYVPAENEKMKARVNYGHLHNNFIQIAAERGLPALASWLWFLVVWARVLYRSAKAGSKIAGGALAAGITFLFCGLTEYTLGDTEVAMVFWFLSGVGLSPASDSETSDVSQ